MQKLGRFFRGRKPRRKIFAFWLAFCVLCGASVLADIVNDSVHADIEYTIEFTSNQPDYGDFGLGYSCQGVNHASSYTSTSSTTTANLVGNAITACPKRQATFVGWSINGSDPTLYTDSNLNIYSSPLNNQDIFFPDGATTATVEAVFERSSDYYDVTVSLSDTSGGHINQVWNSNSNCWFDPIGENSSQLVITARYDSGEITVSNTIGVTIENGYIISGLTASGSVSGSMNGNYLTATISGPGTITINVGSESGYDVEINSVHGAVQVSQSSNNDYEISSNDPSEATLTVTGTNKQATITVTPSGGYIIDPTNPIITTNNNVIASNFNSYDNSFTLTLNGTDTVTINYLQQYNVDIDTVNGVSSINNTNNYYSVDSGNNSNRIELTAAGTNNTITVNTQPSQGYIINSSNPVTTTGSVSYNNDYNNGQFTLTVSGAGSATVNYIQNTTTYTTTINAGTGTASVVSGQGYTVTNSGTGLVTVTASSTGVVVPVTITPPNGNLIDTVTDSNGATYNNNLNGNSFTYTINGDGAINVTYAPAYIVTVDAGDGSVSISGDDIDVSNNGTSQAAITAVGSKTATVTVTPPSGYVVDSSNPITASNGNVSYSNLNGNQFILSMTDSGTVTINYVESDGYTVNFSVNDSSLGKFGYGWWNCSNDLTNSYVSVSDSPTIIYPDNGAVIACAIGDATFGGWSISGNNIESFTIPASVNNESTAAFFEWVGQMGSIYDRIFANDNHNVNVEAIFISSSEYYDVIIEASPNGAGNLQINNTSEYYTVDPNNTRSQSLTLRVDATRASVLTNSVIVRSLDNDYAFDHFEYETGNVSYDHETSSGHILCMTGPDHVIAVFVSSQKINYATDDANVKIVEPGTTKEKTFDSIGALDDDPTGAGFIVPSNYKLMYWQDENGVAVSVDENFVPTGSLVRAGAIYTPVFDTTGNKRASVTVNIPTAGHLRYWSNSQSQWVDLATGAGAILGVGAGDHFASNIYAVADDSNYAFDHWDVIAPDGTVTQFAGATCTEQGVDQANCLDASLGTYGENDYYHVVAVFRTQTINYESNPIPHTKGSKGTIYEPHTSNIKNSDPTTNPIGAEARSTDDYYFLYWSDEDGNIVSYNEIFVPANNQIIPGATYYSNYCNSNYACVLFTVNDNTKGYVNSTTYGDITDYTELPPIELDCVATGCHVHTTIQALSKDTSAHYFHHWEISTDGENFSLLEADNLTATLNPSTILPVNSGQRYIIKAVFTDCEMICFHDYSYGVANSLDTQTYGSVSNIEDNGNVVGARAEVKETAQNPYFAYWVSGCNGGLNGDFTAEKIMSLDPEYYPSTDELALCSDYIAIFYREVERRLVVTTNYSEDERMQVLIRGDSEGGRDATNYINLGLNYDSAEHSGLATIGRNMDAVAPPGYRFAYWTINGEPLINTDGNEITSASISRSSSSNTTNETIPWFTPLSREVNILVANFMPNPLPFTGSSAIWFILGGGVGLVAVPSIILIINERKEQKKGGKK